MKILVIEDHVVFADALAAVLSAEGPEVVGRASTGREGVAAALRLRPDVVLLDLALPDSDGIDVGRAILEKLPDTVIVALTAVDNAESARQAFSAGFRGYLTKQIPLPRLVAAIQSAYDGETIMSPGLVSGFVRTPRSDDDLAALGARQLSARELEVLELLAAGASSTHIARVMGISANTVRTHVQNIHGKLQVHSRLEAVSVALRLGLVRTRQSHLPQ